MVAGARVTRKLERLEDWLLGGSLTQLARQGWLSVTEASVPRGNCFFTHPSQVIWPLFPLPELSIPPPPGE